MKCQKCNKPATFHITEMTDDNHVDLHFCEKHAGEYLKKGASLSAQCKTEVKTGKKPSIALQKTTEDLMEIDFQSCPYCGMGFNDFRKTGRLGCPNDYICFKELLDPLLLNIHGKTEHVGKRPHHMGETDHRSLLIRLRRELDDAISIEDYERASRLRDRIKSIESKTA